MNNSLVGIFKKLGKLTELKTQNKESLVSSINEIADKTNGIDTVKNQVLNSVKSVEAGLNYNTIKITKNDGSTENVMIKVQGGASDSINVFKSSQKGGSFVATEVTSTFTIEDLDTTKDVDLIYNNLFLVKDVDYMVDKESKTVVLGFDLDINEIVYYILTNTSYDYNDLNNLPDLNLKLDKSQIKNTLTETTIGSVLDATQGKVLNDKMGDTTQLLTVDKTNLVNAINELKRTGGGGGATLNVFKSTGGVWGEYVAQSQTNTFTIDGFNGTEKTVDLYYESVLLIPGKLFTISPIGEVTLAFQLDVGETIDYCVIDVSFDYNELANKPDFDGLNNKVGVLNDDRGYLNTMLLPNGYNLDLLKENGFYKVYNGENAPITGGLLYHVMEEKGVGCMQIGYTHYTTGNTTIYYRRWHINYGWQLWQQITTEQTLTNRGFGNLQPINNNADITVTKSFWGGGSTGTNFPSSGEYEYYNVLSFMDSVEYGFQIASRRFGKDLHFRNKNQNWNDWQQLATTTKTPFSLTVKSGWTIMSQNCYVINNVAYVYCMIRKTDTTNIGTGYNVIATLPFTPSGAFQGSCTGVSGAISSGSVDFDVNTNIAITLAKDGVTSLKLSGVIGL